MNLIFPESKEQRRVAIYMRVSTQEQKIDGYGLEAQENKLMDYVNSNKYQNFITKKEWIFKDVHTGSETNRQALQAMLKQVKEKKFDAVLVWKIDRLSRNLQQLLELFEEFEKNKVSFISIQENIDFKGPIGKLIFQIFGAIAQFERELIKGRTVMGKIASAEMGNYTGSCIPYGYKAVVNPGGRGKKLEIVPEEKEWVKNIFDWYIYDGLGLGEIYKKLNELKVPLGKESRSKNGKWTERVIRTLIHNPIYRGIYIANKTTENGGILPENEWTIVNVPPCISEFTFQQGQEVCSKRKGTNKHTEYLLSGKLIDMTVRPPRKFTGARRFKGGFSYRRKQFEKDGTYYGVFEVPAKPIEDYVWGKIQTALKEPEMFIERYVAKEYSNASQIEKTEAELSSFRQQKVEKLLEIDRVEEAYAKGIYDDEKTKEKLEIKNKEVADLDERIQALEDKLRFIGAVDIEVAKLKEASGQVKCRLDTLSKEQKRILVSLFVEKIEMHKEKINGKSKITLEIFYKFNPNKFPTRLVEGCSEEELVKELKSKKDVDGNVNGATCRI